MLGSVPPASMPPRYSVTAYASIHYGYIDNVPKYPSSTVPGYIGIGQVGMSPPRHYIDFPASRLLVAGPSREVCHPGPYLTRHIE